MSDVTVLVSRSKPNPTRVYLFEVCCDADFIGPYGILKVESLTLIFQLPSLHLDGWSMPPSLRAKRHLVRSSKQARGFLQKTQDTRMQHG